MKIVGTLDRQRAEEALKESEEKHRILIETTDTGYVILDEEGRVLDANAEYVRLTGHEKLQQILGKKVTEWTAEHDLTRNAEEVKKCLNRGSVRNLEIDYVNKEGRFTPIEINATVLQTAKEKKIVTLCRDITERKRAEEALHRSEEQAKQLAQESAIMAETGRIISSTLNIDEVYERFAEEVRKLIPFDRITINISPAPSPALSSLANASRWRRHCVRARKNSETYSIMRRWDITNWMVTDGL